MKYLHSNILNKMMLFLILLFFLMMSVSITHAETYSSFKTWGAEGVGTGEFGHPYAVDVDSSGNVYVADTDNNRIQKFDSIGTYITQWSSSLNSPRGIATDSSGNVYVADTNNNRIQKFSSSGTYLTEWVYSFNIPQGIATDSSGNVYVADRNNHVIKKFNSNGEYLATFGASGSGNGQFLYPEDVAVDSSGNIYVAEYGNNRIQKLDSSGNYLAQWGSEGGGNSQFQLPGGITVDSSGYVYVADTDNNRIQKFDSTGTYITQWSSAFASPKGIAVNSSGYVYVADTNNHRIQDFYIRYSYSIEKVVTDVAGRGSSGHAINASDVITYRITVNNTGDGNLTNMNVTDSLISSLPSPTGDNAPTGTLNVGETWIYDPTYTVTQDDLNNKSGGDGFINNTATVDCDQLDLLNDSEAVIADYNLSYSINKTVTSIIGGIAGNVTKAGDVVVYEINVTNDGNIDLTNVTLNDTLINLSEHIESNTSDGILDPEETWTYTGNYTVTQGDIDNNGGGDEYINNTATVDCGQLDLKNASTAAHIDQTPFWVNKTWVYTGNYTVTREDIDNEGEGSGFIENTATVSCGELPNESSSTILPIISIPPVVVAPETEGVKVLVADFAANPESGYAPLSVQFTDKSQNAATWSWDFNGDGTAESNVQNPPAYTYTTAGTFTANLTVSNVNGSASKTATITVLEETGSSDSSSSSGGSSGSSSSGGGGSSGGSAEPANNVEAKEISQVFIGSGSTVRFDFPKNATPVVNVSFDSKKTFGKTNTIVEMLKGKSTFVSALPSNEVYKHVNIWIGNSGVVTNNIENAVVCFKVEKSWIQDKKIDQSSITLNRYSDSKWEQLQTSQSGEDDKYLYFTAKTPGFSPFAITGKPTGTGTEIQSGTSTQESEQNNGSTSANAAAEKQHKCSCKTKQENSWL